MEKLYAVTLLLVLTTCKLSIGTINMSAQLLGYLLFPCLCYMYIYWQ